MSGRVSWAVGSEGVATGSPRGFFAADFPRFARLGATSTASPSGVTGGAEAFFFRGEPVRFAIEDRRHYTIHAWRCDARHLRRCSEPRWGGSGCRLAGMPTCKKCGEDADELISVKIEKKTAKLCEACADLAREESEIAEQSESVVQQMMGFKGRR